MQTWSAQLMNHIRTRGTLTGLYILVLCYFGWSSPAFLQTRNLVNILLQSSSVAIVACGMTFVLLTVGIDLSVGSIMLVSAAVAGKIVLQGMPLWTALVAILATGVICGAVNAFLITRLSILPFVVTLATMYIGRGLGLWITETRAMNLPEEILRIGTARIAGIPVPVIVLAVVVALGHLMLTQSVLGRHIYGVGHSRETARTAGISVNRVISTTYILCGFCAALGGLVSVAQLGAVSPTFGYQREFAAVAAAVLGGTSLFGGRGSIFPGTLLGAVLIQTVENGLVIVNADPYLYPLVISAIIFTAVATDSAQFARLQELGRRKIRVDKSA
jgi:ribose transport system permease protein